MSIARLLLTAAVLLLAGFAGAADQLGTTLVVAADGVEPEQQAAEELRTYLGQITGREFTLQTEDQPVAGAAIYVGRTTFGLRAGLDWAGFGEEEYLLRTVGPHLVIGGGCPNGTWNGVQHFLQRVLGCRFFRWDCEVIPHLANLSLPDLDLRRSPTFARREIYTAYRDFTPEGRAKLGAFCRRNFMNATRSAYDRMSIACPDATRCHNEFIWVEPQKYAVSNPEFFTNQGKFDDPSKVVGRNQDASLCWTSHQVWDITLARLREIIKADREALPAWQWPRVYQISQNDNTKYCHCADCEAVFKAEGSRAGALLQFVNYVAEAIAREYPDVMLQTFAYVETEFLPETIRPAANVILQWCDLYTRSDCYRPLAHPGNAGQQGRLDAWKGTGCKVAVWDYWNMGIEPGPYFAPPRVETMVDAIAPDLRYFAECGVESWFVEAEFCNEHPQNFCELQHYLGLQLAADVSLSEETLIREYLAGCYGPAAPAMTELLHLLRGAVKAEPQPMFYILNTARPYANGPFLAQVYRLLKQAQAAVSPGSDDERRVQQELITPLAVMLRNPQYDWSKLLGLTKQELLAEYRQVRLGRYDQPWIDPARRTLQTERYERETAGLRLEIPTPERFKACEPILKFAWPDMTDAAPGAGLEADPDSPLGKALVARGQPGKQDAQHDLTKPYAGGLYPNSFGIYSPYDKSSSEVIRTDLPQDEQYHWYKIKAWDFRPNAYLWAFYWIARVDLAQAWTNADGLPGDSTWETWCSVKYTGPAYVKGSTKQNGVFLDQVILVKPGAFNE